MKLSAAIIVLTVGTVGASIVTRQGRRRLAAYATAVAADNDIHVLGILRNCRTNRTPATTDHLTWYYVVSIRAGK